MQRDLPQPSPPLEASSSARPAPALASPLEASGSARPAPALASPLEASGSARTAAREGGEGRMRESGESLRGERLSSNCGSLREKIEEKSSTSSAHPHRALSLTKGEREGRGT